MHTHVTLAAPCDLRLTSGLKHSCPRSRTQAPSARRPAPSAAPLKKARPSHLVWQPEGQHAVHRHDLEQRLAQQQRPQLQRPHAHQQGPAWGVEATAGCKRCRKIGHGREPGPSRRTSSCTILQNHPSIIVHSMCARARTEEVHRDAVVHRDRAPAVQDPKLDAVAPRGTGFTVGRGDAQGGHACGMRWHACAG